jgi:hypothetical protein
VLRPGIQGAGAINGPTCSGGPFQEGVLKVFSMDRKRLRLARWSIAGRLTRRSPYDLLARWLIPSIERGLTDTTSPFRH